MYELDLQPATMEKETAVAAGVTEVNMVKLQLQCMCESAQGACVKVLSVCVKVLRVHA